MLWTTFLNNVRQLIFQNVWREVYDESVWYTTINEGLYDIYMILNSKKIWEYSFTEETVTASWTNEYETTYSILWIVDEKYGDEKNTGVLADSLYHLNKKNFATNDSMQIGSANTPMRQFTLLVDQTLKTWVKGIKTSEDYTSILIRYFRWPTLVTVDNINDQIDLPEVLIRALKLYCFMELIPPVFMENGANLSQFYYARYKDALQVYSDCIGSSIDFSFTSR